jgi:DNA primase
LSRISRIKQKHSLPEVAKNAGMELHESGSGYLGLCPFHKDSRPSFSIFPADGNWYFKCHAGSCNVSGDLIDFVGMLKFGSEWDVSNTEMFRKALDSLENETPTRTIKTPTATYHKRTPNVTYLWKMALYFYKRELNENTQARNYIKRRKLPQEVLDKWHFGFCPQYDSDFLSLASISRKEQVYAGLVRQGKNKFYEFFHNRVVFADVDARGNPLYLYGRAIEFNRNKYLGVPNFRKPIFGIELPFVDRSDVLLMEGALNAMIAIYWGYSAIALSGTSLSTAHVKIIRDKLDGRTLRPVPDNDKAGMDALSRWQELMPFMTEPVFLPEEHKDLNDFYVLDENARERFAKLV